MHHPHSHTKDRGCTAPGCDIPGYLTQVHHVDEWATGGQTNIDTLTFACKAHHPLISPGGWKTRKLKDGTTEWIPPPTPPPTYPSHPAPTTTTTPNGCYPGTEPKSERFSGT